jgi:outer membrane receptor protein involved in Fe transport
MNIQRFLGATALVGVLSAMPAVAFAKADKTNPVAAPEAAPQTDPQAAAATSDDKDTGNNEIVITGSRITNPNLQSITPITTVSAEELKQTGNISVGDALNNLPALQSTFSQANSTRFLGTSGLNLLDLRGLGTQRTLVLVNGRRHVGADILSNAVSPDVNTFPTDLIERVDVVTGGDSAIYGSDALAGVVNFVLKDHYEGLQFRGQGNISQWGDAGAYYASILAGKNFAGGRGNLAIDLEYARQNSLYASDRDYLSHTDGFVTVDTDLAGVGGTTGNNTLNSDGNPDAVFFRDIRVGTFSSGGLVAFSGLPAGNCGKDVAGRAYTCNYLFTPDGNLVLQNGTRVGLAGGTAAAPNATPAGSFIGGNGDTRREGHLLQLLPQLDRYSANLIGHFEISPAFVPFIEAKYVRTDSFGQGSSGPAFFTGSTIDGFYERPRLDNPFLSSQARGILSTQAATAVNAGFNPTSGAAYKLIDNGDGTFTTIAQQQAAALAAINGGSYRFILRKNQTDLGIRSEAAKRETFRIVGGVRGTFNDDWKYEVSVNYGQFNESTKVLGNVNVQRELLALDAVDQGKFQTGVANGNIVCGSKLNPARAYDDFAGNAANLAADIAACVPYNPFGSGVSAAAKNYILQDTISRGKITQFDITASVSGDTSQFFNLPGGPVYFAVGGEYRKETAFFQEDPLVEAGYTFYNAISKFDPPAFEVKEGFAEVRIPILKDLPFANSLEISGAGRVSHYKGSAGTVWTYNAGAVWAPVQDVKFRANYSRAIRAPNLSDLYSPQSQNFAPGFGDPCSAINIANGTQYRAANCAAAGINTTGATPYDFRYAQSLEIVSGGNPDLKSEKSDSYTYGVVIQPRWVPGLSLSVDYYNISVNNVITAPSAQGIVNSCYDSPTTNNQFCALFQRDNAAGAVTGTPFRIIEGSLQQTLLNYAKLKVRGIDTDLSYRRRLGGVDLTAHLVWTHSLTNESFTDPTQPGFADNFQRELGSPKDAWNLNLNADFGQLYVNTQFRYLSKMAVGAIENHETFQGRPASNLDDFSIPFYPDVLYIDGRIGVNINKGSNFYFGVDNLTNRIPPLGATGIGAGSGIYESIGRRFYAGFTAKF